MEKVCVGVTQFRVEKGKKKNLDKVEYWVSTVAQNGAEIVVLPEMFVCPYELKYFPFFAESFPQGEALTLLAQLAKKHRIYLVGGSIPERFNGRFYNSSFIFNPQGELVARHRKIHLFDVELERLEFKESRVFSPGDSATLFDTPWGKIGVMICYDVRFPEVARFYALKGAVMVVVPAAFNHITGPLHWTLTFRARALDNQVFMIGASPAPNPESQYRAYGHSIIVNPWGQVIREMGEEEGFLMENLDLGEIKRVRRSLPLLQHRREEVYMIFR
ncbi:MAG: carbon-nitrogen hydrolase family protein [Atribacterota bacterium]